MISVITPTHNPKFIDEIYDCLKAQSYQDWEWVVYVDHEIPLMRKHAHDSRVKYIRAPKKMTSIGEIKHNAFMQGTGDYLVELDHDDLLSRDALQEIVTAFKESGADFVYSNFSEFFENGLFHYYPNYEKNNWLYRTSEIDGKQYSECVSFDPSASSLSLIYYAPNHVRCWKTEFYKRIGGHNKNYPICDDHELLVRTYLKGKMHRIDKCLYFYRMHSNTFSQNLEKIKTITNQIYIDNIEALILREGELKNLPCYDLGGAFSSPKGWKTVDLQDSDVIADLNEKWPFEDSSVLAFRAFDIFEHLKDKQHVMKEASRCLVNGGYLHVSVPDGRHAGFYADPTHVSGYVPQSFWYYTRAEQMKYIRNNDVKFLERRLFNFYPSEWHKENDYMYVKAELVCVKNGVQRIPGYSRL